MIIKNPMIISSSSSSSSSPPRFILLFLFLSITSPSLSTAPFFYPNNLTLSEDAHFIDHSISLTQQLNSCSPSSASSSSYSSGTNGLGRAFYAYPVRFLDPSINSTASFLCRFSFSIIPTPSCPHGDGLAFLITSNADSFTPSSGFIALPKLQDSSSFIAVEFDTSFNPTLGDTDGNHIGIDVNSIVSVASVHVVPIGFDLKSGRRMTAWIEYQDGIKLVRVWVGYTRIRPPSPVLVAQVDLSKHYKEYMHVGFSASNGQGSALHIISHWRFKTFGFSSIPIPIDNLGEGDCLMCYPGDSSIGMESSSAHHRKAKVGDMALGLGGLAAFLFSAILIASVCAIYWITNSRTAETARRSVAEQKCSRFQMNKVPTRLSLTEIKSATMGFNRNRIIGEGASATVYQGHLPSGDTVAVKRFGRENRLENCRSPFTTEFATMVGCLRHKNLVQLQGWCCEGSELLLIYEYMPNGSLDKILHQNSGSSLGYLTWEQRKRIVLGVASALTYLHEECERQIIHRDVKSCNIMLDAEFNAKLGDFGLAEVYEHSCLTRAVTIPAGTMGYLAPEYVYYGVPTVKTDVYSFGVVVLEVATGRRPVDEDGVVLVDWVWEMWERRKLVQAGDPKLRGKCDKDEMQRMLVVGLCCVHPDNEKRITVREAARILKREAPLPLLPMRKPAVRIRSALPEMSEEILSHCGDQSPGTDDLPYMTPRSHFT